jgi:hypothetical protein
MIEAATVLTIFDKALNVLGLIREGRVKRDSHIDSSLHALYAALSETKAYVVSLNDGSRHNRSKERKIAQLWHDASVPLRRIDPDLARICFLKGSYWLEPEAWTEVMIQENQIALDNVFAKTRELLVGK